MMQRYEYNCECARMVICPDGNYTKYKDTAQLEAENAALREKLDLAEIERDQARTSFEICSHSLSTYTKPCTALTDMQILNQAKCFGTLYDDADDTSLVSFALAIVSQAQAIHQNAYPRILEGQALQQLPLPEEFLSDVPKQQK